MLEFSFWVFFVITQGDGMAVQPFETKEECLQGLGEALVAKNTVALEESCHLVTVRKVDKGSFVPKSTKLRQGVSPAAQIP